MAVKAGLCDMTDFFFFGSICVWFCHILDKSGIVSVEISSFLGRYIGQTDLLHNPELKVWFQPIRKGLG